VSISLNINGIVYPFPVEGEENWGPDVTNWAQAITQGALLKGTGVLGATQVFTLTGDVDFGATYGLRVAYLRSRTATAATSGLVRLANAEEINWRNQANSANLPLRVSTANWLQFNSIDLVDVSTAQNLSNKVFGSHLLPTASNTYDLGSTGTRWKDGWFQGNLTVAGSLSAGSVTFADFTATGNITLGDATSDTVNVIARFVSNLIPSSSTTYDLGSSSLVWNNSYSNRVLVGNGSTATPSIAFISETGLGTYRDASGSITLGANTGSLARLIIRSNDLNAATVVLLNSNGGGSGDQLISFCEASSSTGAWSVGRHDSDSSAFKISQGLVTLGTNDYFRVTTSGELTLGAISSVQTHTIIGNAVARQNSLGVTVTEDSLSTVTLNDNQASATNAFTYTAAGNEHIVLDYSISRSTARETGTILIGQNGTDVEFNRVHGGTGDTGITFSVDISGGLVRLRYTSTSTGSSATMRAIARRWGS